MRRLVLFGIIGAFIAVANPAFAEQTKAEAKKAKSDTAEYAAEYRARKQRNGDQSQDRDCSCRGQYACSCAPTHGGYGYGYGYGYGGGPGTQGWSRSNWSGSSDIPTAGYTAPVRR